MKEVFDIELRKISVEDIGKLIEISIQTFSETFASTNTPEDLDHYFAYAYDEEKLLKELQCENSWFYFAEVDGALAGYLKVNVGDAQTELQEDDGYEVERIYVLKKYYGSGIGAKLMDFAIEKGRALERKYLWLGVFEANFRAQNFYKKYGLSAFSEHVFMMGESAQRDVLMKMDL